MPKPRFHKWAWWQAEKPSSWAWAETRTKREVFRFGSSLWRKLTKSRLTVRVSSGCASVTTTASCSQPVETVPYSFVRSKIATHVEAWSSNKPGQWFPSVRRFWQRSRKSSTKSKKRLIWLLIMRPSNPHKPLQQMIKSKLAESFRKSKTSTTPLAKTAPQIESNLTIWRAWSLI